MPYSDVGVLNDADVISGWRLGVVLNGQLLAGQTLLFDSDADAKPFRFRFPPDGFRKFVEDNCPSNIWECAALLTLYLPSIIEPNGESTWTCYESARQRRNLPLIEVLPESYGLLMWQHQVAPLLLLFVGRTLSNTEICQFTKNLAARHAPKLGPWEKFMVGPPYSESPKELVAFLMSCYPDRYVPVRCPLMNAQYLWDWYRGKL